MIVVFSFSSKKYINNQLQQSIYLCNKRNMSQTLKYGRETDKVKGRTKDKGHT